MLLRYFVIAALLVGSTIALPVAPDEEPVVAEQFFDTDYDVIIIGGGPAGLQAAMSLGRLRRKALVIDSQEYRNNATLYAHDVILLDGTPPPRIRAYAQVDLLPYTTVNYTVGKVASIQNVANGTRFMATNTDGQVYSARKIVLATGVTDILPDFPGMDVIWGTGAFWCLWCDGWEHRDAKLGVLGFELSDDAITGSLLYDSITIYSNGTTPDQVRAQVENSTFPYVFETLQSRGIDFDTRVISGFSFVDPSTRENSIRITFADGSNDIVSGILIKTQKVQKSPLAGYLGIANSGVDVKTLSNAGGTNVFGVYAIGDMASSSKNIPNALFTAKAAAVRIVATLSREESRLAAGLSNWRD